MSKKRKTATFQQEEDSVLESLHYRSLLHRFHALEQQLQRGQVAVRVGDLLQCDAQYIVHQINCCHQGRAAGIAAVIFASYPYADTYALRDTVDEPGSIQIFPSSQFERGIINLCGQLYKGRPDGRRETAAQRECWFLQGLEQLAAVAGIKEVAFPHGIGCGMAGGNWLSYSSMITRWAAAHSSIAVTLYLLPEKA